MNRFIIVLLVISIFSCSHENEELQYNINNKIIAYNGLAETFSVIDPETLSISNDIKLTGIWPNHMVYNEGFLYMVNSGDNNIVKYDGESFTKVSEIYLGDGKNPYMIDIDDKYIYVTCLLTNSVIILDKATEDIVTEVSVGARPQGILVVGNNLFVTNTAYNGKSFDTGSFSLINTQSLELIKTVELQYKNPQTLFYNELRDEVHIICSGVNDSSKNDGAVVIVKDGIISGSFAVGGSPIFGEGAIDGDRVYLASYGTLISYNLSTNELYEVVILNKDELTFSSIVYDNYIFVSFFNLDKISVYDKSTLDLVKEIQGSEGVGQLLYIQ